MNSQMNCKWQASQSYWCIKCTMVNFWKTFDWSYQMIATIALKLTSTASYMYFLKSSSNTFIDFKWLLMRYISSRCCIFHAWKWGITYVNFRLFKIHYCEIYILQCHFRKLCMQVQALVCSCTLLQMLISQQQHITIQFKL